MMNQRPKVKNNLLKDPMARLVSAKDMITSDNALCCPVHSKTMFITWHNTYNSLYKIYL